MTKDTLLLAEEVIADKLMEIKKDERSNEGDKVSIEIVTKLMEKVNEAERLELEYEDKKEKRIADAEQAERSEKLESRKDLRRAAVEISKVVLTVGIGAAISCFMQKRAFKFEETGSISSYTSKESCHLPKFWK